MRRRIVKLGAALAVVVGLGAATVISGCAPMWKNGRPVCPSGTFLVVHDNGNGTNSYDCQAYP